MKLVHISKKEKAKMRSPLWLVFIVVLFIASFVVINLNLQIVTMLSMPSIVMNSAKSNVRLKDVLQFSSGSVLGSGWLMTIGALSKSAAGRNFSVSLWFPTNVCINGYGKTNEKAAIYICTYADEVVKTENGETKIKQEFP